MSDIGAERVGNDMVVTVAGAEGDRITIKDWFKDTAGLYRIEQLVFADGATLSHSQLATLALTTTNTGTDGDDVIVGTGAYSEVIQGGDANGGNTSYTGGTGNDTITGTQYADTYVFRCRSTTGSAVLSTGSRTSGSATASVWSWRSWTC